MRTTDQSTHLPVPAPLRRLTEAVTSRGVTVNRAGLSEFLDSPQAAVEFLTADRARRLLARTDHRDVVRMGQLKLSARTHRIVETADRVGHDLRDLKDPFVPRQGYTFVRVEPSAVPLYALAHLTGDARLEAAMASGDPYQHLADRIDLPGSRGLVKMVLFKEFFGSDRIHNREVASRLREVIPVAYEYRDECKAGVGNLDHVEQLTAQAANGALAHVMSRVSLYARPVFLHASTDLLVEVETDHLAHVTGVLDSVTEVTTNRITLPVDYVVV